MMLYMHEQIVGMGVLLSCWYIVRVFVTHQPNKVPLGLPPQRWWLGKQIGGDMLAVIGVDLTIFFIDIRAQYSGENVAYLMHFTTAFFFPFLGLVVNHRFSYSQCDKCANEIFFYLAVPGMGFGRLLMQILWKPQSVGVLATGPISSSSSPVWVLDNKRIAVLLTL